MSQREFSDEEMQHILQEAARLSTQDGPRHSLQSIQAIAAEAQIGPEHVAQAARSLAVAPHADQPSRLIESATVRLTRRVERPARPADAMAAVALARTALGETGTVHDVAGGTEWRYDNGFSSAAVSIVPDASGTVVRVETHADGRQWALAAGVVAGSAFAGMAAAASGGLPAGIAVGAAALAATALAARSWWNRSARATRTRVSAMVSEISARLSDDESRAP